ncbi:LLM class flavin-dependent oxidoreductase [Nocardia suismassiliense]|uniref:LLM class flavin-dependent oxidoreductase n=1 Tax=Nocardia suismassiliense TaxID=2077092 RepID=UPI000D1E1DBF|nr:LLM class flavin-dependent oxidoreductase [Nocardia suismassiliense]
MSAFPHAREIRAANPVFGRNRLKLGVFGLNSIGCALTLVPEAYEPSWDGSLAAATAADAAGFEAIVPYARWRSYLPDQPAHRSSVAMECFTWAAAVAARTEHSAIFATCHVPVVHPIMAAKLASTVDQIAHGRFALNVVAGWHEPEFRMFGVTLPDHEHRYDQAAEWAEVLRRAWQPEPFDFEGAYYRVDGGYLAPSPAQAPAPPIMNAGGSARGRDFAARYADLAFVMIESERPEDIASVVRSYRAHARDTYGRDLQIWTPAHVVLADTDRQARDYLQRYAVDHGDFAAADAFIAGQVATGSNLSPPALARLRARIVQGGGGFPLVGAATTIADRLTTLSAAGLDGVLLSWVDYEPGIRRFAREVLPLLESRALRHPPTTEIGTTDDQ